MGAEEHRPEPTLHYLFPTFDITVSVNGHLEDYRLSRQAYVDVVEDEDADPLNYVKLWAWFEEHLHTYLLDVVESTGPVDTDKVKLVGLRITVLAGPEGMNDVLDCEGCLDNYRDALLRAATDGDEEEGDNDD